MVEAKQNVSILLAANEKYARPCAVTILSILVNSSSPEEIYFYILTPDFSVDSTQRIQTLCDKFQSKVVFISIDLNLFNNLPISYSHFSLDNYSRILAPELCKGCDRLLYLDCDLIILGDVVKLFDFDLKGKPIGAVPHVQLPYQDTFIKNFNLKEIDIYFNSGVLLMNASTWRSGAYSGQLLEVASKYSDKLHFADQDLLNLFFWNNYYHLPGVWNVEARLYREKLLGLPQTKEITERIQSPQIIHYTGPDKPWLSRQYVPKREIYLEYSDRLTTLLNWSPDIKIKNCNFSGFSSFIYSCIYFRLAFNFRKLT